MHPFIQNLNEGKIMAADGATGTNLQRMGLKPGVSPEDLVIENPDILERLASAFVQAGSDIILTCTFGGTPIRMQESRHDAAEVNRQAVAIARRAASARPNVLVGGSIGPTGQIMQPYGPLTRQAAFDSFVTQAQALADAGVDLFVIETMFAIEEAEAAFDAVRSVSDLPIVVSFSYDRGVRTMMGVKPTTAARLFKDKGAAAIGANCGTTLENMLKIVQEYAAAVPGFPIWAKPNAGQPRVDDEGRAVYEVTPAQMADAARANIAAGACVVGGCCGTSPEHLAAIAAAAHA